MVREHVPSCPATRMLTVTAFKRVHAWAGVRTPPSPSTGSNTGSPAGLAWASALAIEMDSQMSMKQMRADCGGERQGIVSRRSGAVLAGRQISMSVPCVTPCPARQAQLGGPDAHKNPWCKQARQPPLPTATHQAQLRAHVVQGHPPAHRELGHACRAGQGRAGQGRAGTRVPETVCSEAGGAGTPSA